MNKSNKVAYVAYNIGVVSFVIMVFYTLMSMLVVISSIVDGYEEEVLYSLPWRIGLLAGGLAETGICFVIAEVVQILDDSSRYLSQCVKFLRKKSEEDENKEKLYDEKLPEI